MSDSVIICGSKPYENLNLNHIVDTFDTIVRNNMLINTNGYGKKPSSIQVMNCHVYERYNNKITEDEWCSFYKNENIEKEHVKNFVKYINQDNGTNYVFYQDNNSLLMNAILNHYKIPVQMKRVLRCGMGHVAEALKYQQIPFLIGFSLHEEDNIKHCYSNKDELDSYHDRATEAEIIIALHERGLVDASFCALLDQENISFDKSLLKPTQKSVKILNELGYRIE
jgi:hypothetical protein|tara:strand:+ start:1826 stop:2500 length:675 start_codon:yes stop_codon:yes gene_type:complete